MIELLVWLWLGALVAQASGCISMILKLTPIDRKQPHLIWWLICFVIILIEVPVYFIAIRMRSGPVNVGIGSFAWTVVDRWLWAITIWLKVLFVYRKIGD